MTKKKEPTEKVVKEKRTKVKDLKKETSPETTEEVNNTLMTRQVQSVSNSNEVSPENDPESTVVPLEEIEIKDAGLLDSEDPAKAIDIEQVSEEGIEQEKLPNVPEVDSEVKDDTETRTGDQKEKPADQEEYTAISRHDHGIAPHIIEGRRSEYPRG